jgi:hypothetical protein
MATKNRTLSSIPSLLTSKNSGHIDDKIDIEVHKTRTLAIDTKLKVGPAPYELAAAVVVVIDQNFVD